MKTIQTKNIMKTNARTAGVLYLIVILTGLFSEMFVRSGIIVPGDAASTASNISANSFLFRIGLISDLIMIMSDIGLALLFYLLLKPVNQGLSLLAAFFRLVQDAIMGLNMLNYYFPLFFLNKSETLSGFTNEQSDSLSLLFLDAHSMGYLISGVFMGVSCVFLGYLMYKSGYFPKWLGALVVATGFSYLIDSFTNFLFPGFASTSEILVIAVAVASELSFCLFLLIKGVNIKFNTEARIS